MSTTTQYNPVAEFNQKLLAQGLSKTVYALVTPETEAAKAFAQGYFEPDGRAAYFDQFREAWTGKQDAYHREFFDEWVKWSSPVIDMDRTGYPFFYPTAGASEPLRQIIFDFAAHGGQAIHVFQGEYEGFKAMGEAAGLEVVEHPRGEWRDIVDDNTLQYAEFGSDRLFFVSQPSAIDGNVWHDFNEFVSEMPQGSVVADITYVGAVPKSAIRERFNLNWSSIRNVVFSLSKPFGAYYDRIGGVFSREQDLGLFGNIWFKSLAALSIGRELMRRHDVFAIAERYRPVQEQMCERATQYGLAIVPSDVYMIGNGGLTSDPIHLYLTRADRVRVCLTPGMAQLIGMAA